MTRVVVGIPSYQEADSIAFVTEQADAGLSLMGESVEGIIINADADSADGTSGIFLSTPTRSQKRSLICANHKGKGSNVRQLFEYCQTHDVDVLALIDADVRSVTPEWPIALATPILEGRADYVVPTYLRQHYEAATTNHFVYPLVSSFFGQRIRQPIGGEFGLSRRLISFLLEQSWPDEVYGYGIDIFMTMHAAGAGFRIAHAQLGTKLHKPSFPKVSRIFPEVVASAFGVLRKYSMSDVIDHSTVPVGILDTTGCHDEAEVATVLSSLTSLAEELLPVYQEWVGAGSAGRWREEILNAKKEPYSFGAASWAEIATACVSRAILGASSSDDRLLAEQLYPVAQLRSISFSRTNRALPVNQVEDEINHQLVMFETALRSRLSEERSRHSE